MPARHAAKVVVEHEHRDQAPDATRDERDNVPSAATTPGTNAITRRTVRSDAPGSGRPAVRPAHGQVIQREVAEPDDEAAAVPLDEPARMARPVTKKVLALDPSIDRRRVPERWRTGGERTTRNETADRDHRANRPAPAKSTPPAHQGKSGKPGKKQRRW